MPLIPTTGPRRLVVLLLVLGGCAEMRPAPPPARTAPPPASAGATAQQVVVPDDADKVGRWIAVDVLGDDAQTRDIRTGVLEKTLVVNPGGHVILRGVDRAPGGGTASYTGTLVGRVLTFADLPGAAILAHEGTRLILIDPSGRQTRFIRDAD